MTSFRACIEYFERVYDDWTPDLSDDIAEFRRVQQQRIDELQTLAESETIT